MVQVGYKQNHALRLTKSTSTSSTSASSTQPGGPQPAASLQLAPPQSMPAYLSVFASPSSSAQFATSRNTLRWSGSKQNHSLQQPVFKQKDTARDGSIYIYRHRDTMPPSMAGVLPDATGGEFDSAASVAPPAAMLWPDHNAAKYGWRSSRGSSRKSESHWRTKPRNSAIEPTET